MLLPFQVHKSARSFYMSQTLNLFGSGTRSPAGVAFVAFVVKFGGTGDWNIYTCLISSKDESFILLNNKMQRENNVESSVQYNWFPFSTLVDSLKV